MFDIYDAMRSAREEMARRADLEEFKLYAPGPKTAALWREMFPGIEVVVLPAIRVREASH